MFFQIVDQPQTPRAQGTLPLYHSRTRSDDRGWLIASGRPAVGFVATVASPVTAASDGKHVTVVGGDHSWLKNEVICVNLTIRNNDFNEL